MFGAWVGGGGHVSATLESDVNFVGHCLSPDGLLALLFSSRYVFSLYWSMTTICTVGCASCVCAVTRVDEHTTSGDALTRRVVCVNGCLHNALALFAICLRGLCACAMACLM